MNKQKKIFIFVIGFFFSNTSLSQEISLNQVIQLAIENDPWFQGNQYKQQALDDQSISAGQLPDPKLSVGIANLPTDTFKFNQEPMTQFKVGVNQQFPRGKTRELKQQRLEQLSEQTIFERENRKAMVTLEITQLWLEWLKQQKIIALIEKDRSLFEDLADIVNAMYSSALGKTQQHDIIQAQVELIRLEDRLYRLSETADVYQAKLNEWLPVPIDNLKHLELPAISFSTPNAIDDMNGNVNNGKLSQYFLQHPKILLLDQQIKVGETAIESAKQQYKPQWGVNGSYAWRDDDSMGNDRADFLSLGVTFDLPLFTHNRQDKQVSSAVAQTEVIKTDKHQLLRQFIAEANQAKAKLKSLDQRQQLYQTRLLQEIHEQVEASLTAYTNENADFNQVVRTRITELNSRIDALTIDVDRLKTIAHLNYLFTNMNDSTGAKL